MRVIVVLASIVFLMPFVVYSIYFNGGVSNIDQAWANFGSFIGGIGSTIFSFAGFIAVISTFNIQKKDNEEEKAMANIFKYLELINIGRQNLSFSFLGNEAITGEVVIERFNGMIAYLSAKKQDLKVKNNMDLEAFEKENPNIKSEVLRYEILRYSVEGYANLIEKAMNYIDKIRVEKSEYLDILFSQLTNTEKAFIVIMKPDLFLNNKINREKINMQKTPFEFNSSLHREVSSFIKQLEV